MGSIEVSPNICWPALLSAEITDFRTSMQRAWPASAAQTADVPAALPTNFYFDQLLERTPMSYSISAAKAKATHDTAMSIIDKEAKERASRTAHLRALRLAREAEAVAEIVTVAGSKSRARRKGS